MIEILAVLAIIGVLSIAAVWGYSYAMTKHKANQIAYDVAAARQLVMAKKRTGVIFDLDFDATSHLTYQGLKLKHHERNVSIVMTKGIMDPVCRMLLDMQGENSFYMYMPNETDPSEYIKMTVCSNVEERTIYFASINSDSMSAQCGAHEHAELNGCECDTGYTRNAITNDCDNDACGQKPEAGPSVVVGDIAEECCEQFGWSWNGSACVCPGGQVWDAAAKNCGGTCPAVPARLNQISRKVCCDGYASAGLEWDDELSVCKCADDAEWNSSSRKCLSCGEKPLTPTTVDNQECCEQFGWSWDATEGCGCATDYLLNPGTGECVYCGRLRPVHPDDVTSEVCCTKWGWTWTDDACGCEDGYEWDAVNRQCVEAACGDKPAAPTFATSQKCCEEWGWAWTNGACGCPANTTWLAEAEVCVPDDMCVYYMEMSTATDYITHTYTQCDENNQNCVQQKWYEGNDFSYRAVKDDCVWPEWCKLTYVSPDKEHDNNKVAGYTYGYCEHK